MSLLATKRASILFSRKFWMQFKVARTYLYACWLCFWIAFFWQERFNRFLWFLASLIKNGQTLSDFGPRYLEDILKLYHQSRTLRSSRDHLRLEEPNFNIKTHCQRAFSVAVPDYGASSPLKFELVLMLIFLNLSWKGFFLKRYMTFSFIIFVFVFFPF